jgi:hypothetical protein
MKNPQGREARYARQRQDPHHWRFSVPVLPRPGAPRQLKMQVDFVKLTMKVL